MRTATVALSVLMLASLAAAPLASAPPNLSGSWKLNKGLSDDPQAKMPQRAGSRTTGGSGTAGRMQQASESMTVAQEGNKVEITYQQGRPMTLVADGSTQEEQTPRGATIKTTSKWEGAVLTTTRDTGRAKVVTRFELSADGKQLTVTREFERSRADTPIVLKSVYDRSE
jgi:hypothetical protein